MFTKHCFVRKKRNLNLRKFASYANHWNEIHLKLSEKFREKVLELQIDNFITKVYFVG